MIPAVLVKKRSIAILCGCLLLPLAATAATITLDAGYLRGNNGATLSAATTSTAANNGGALLLLVASGSTSGTTFTAPGAGQFVAGGDAILGYTNSDPSANGSTPTTTNGFEFNNNGGTQTAAPATGQETLNLLSQITIPATATISASAYVELRWYPNITLAQYLAGATPAANSYYGTYNPAISNSANKSLNPDGGALWEVPASGNVTLNFFTTDNSQGGTQAVTEGYANNLVPVPEPSTGILGGMGLVVAVGAVRMVRRRTLAS